MNYNPTDLVMYVFSHQWLSQTQRGIQMVHAVAEMSVDFKYQDVYKDWAIFGKTIIQLNGGSSQGLGRIFNKIVVDDENTTQILALSLFNEDQESLNLALTCVACIVDKKCKPLWFDNFQLAV